MVLLSVTDFGKGDRGSETVKVTIFRIWKRQELLSKLVAKGP